MTDKITDDFVLPNYLETELIDEDIRLIFKGKSYNYNDPLIAQHIKTMKELLGKPVNLLEEYSKDYQTDLVENLTNLTYKD